MEDIEDKIVNLNFDSGYKRLTQSYLFSVMHSALLTSFWLIRDFTLKTPWEGWHVTDSFSMVKHVQSACVYQFSSWSVLQQHHNPVAGLRSAVPHNQRLHSGCAKVERAKTQAGERTPLRVPELQALLLHVGTHPHDHVRPPLQLHSGEGERKTPFKSFKLQFEPCPQVEVRQM